MPWLEEGFNASASTSFIFVPPTLPPSHFLTSQTPPEQWPPPMTTNTRTPLQSRHQSLRTLAMKGCRLATNLKPRTTSTAHALHPTSVLPPALAAAPPTPDSSTALPRVPCTSHCAQCRRRCRQPSPQPRPPTPSSNSPGGSPTAGTPRRLRRR